jgi:hypothetical protein
VKAPGSSTQSGSEEDSSSVMSQETLRTIIRKILIVVFSSKFPSHILVSVTIYDQLLQHLDTYKELTVICFHQESKVVRGEKALGAIVIAVSQLCWM